MISPSSSSSSSSLSSSSSSSWFGSGSGIGDLRLDVAAADSFVRSRIDLLLAGSSYI